MKVPFLDLQAHHAPYRGEFNRVIEEVIDLGAFAGGPFVAQFEKEFAAYCQTSHARGVGSGTDALWLCLLAMGIGAGDEVITVANSFFATAEAISQTGATPVFVEIDEGRHTMDPSALEAAVTERTKAIIPVHLFGQPADMDPILELARERGLRVIEDAAQAHGAEYNGRRAGSLADAGCFSFYPGKNLGAFGEAGAITTNDPDLAEKIGQLRDHGQSKKYHHSRIGWNCRMDGIQAAVLSLKLAHLERSTELRRTWAAEYAEALAGVEELVTPVASEDVRHVYHVYAVRVQQRERVMQHLADRGIGCGIHYPVPIHLQPAYGRLGYQEGSFPITERCAREVLSLPMFPELTKQQVDYVAEVLQQAIEAGVPA